MARLTDLEAELVGAVPEDHTDPDGRRVIALEIAEMLTDAHDGLVLRVEEGEGIGGGHSSSVLAYARVDGELKPFAINVYGGASISTKCDRLLAEAERRTELEERVERVKKIVADSRMLVAPSPDDTVDEDDSE